MELLLQPVLISITAGILILLIPKRFRKTVGFFSLGVTVYILIASFRIFLNSPLDIGFLYLDNLSRFIVPGIALFGFLVVLYSLRFMSSYSNVSSYYTYILWTIGCSLLASLANNIPILVIAWGFLGFTLYMLINISGPRAASISKKTLIIIGASDSFMILGFSLVWFITGSVNLNNIKLIIDNPLKFWAFLSIAIAAFAKAGVMPFHTWIPDTAKEAPIPVTAFLPASVDKLLGIYLLARLVLNVFVLNSLAYNLLMIIGAATIIAGVMMALIQHDFKRLLGYHAVSQVGYMVLGIGTGNPIGIAGGLFHMLNNAIYKSCLFLSGGNVEYKMKTSELDSLGGLARIMPVTFFAGLIASLSISGIPPFNGFVSKWMVYQGLIEKGRTGGSLWIFCLVAAMFGSGLTLASFIKFIHAIFLGSPYNKMEVHKREAPIEMLIAPVVLALLCIIFGVFVFQIPLRYFIRPAVGEYFTFIGRWQSLKASLFLFLGLGTGFIIYLLGNFKGMRVSSSYIGGENLQDDMRISGIEFYNTIKEITPLKNIYKKAEEGFFDIYEQKKNIVFAVGKFFQYLHNGVLPTYLVWTLLGMMILFWRLLR